MSALQRVLGSIGAAFPSRSPGAFPRSTVASIGVVTGWLFINLLAYGAVLVPGAPEESLLATRDGGTVSASRSQTLPNTPFFGVAAAEGKELPDVDLIDIPITQLNLVLSGVLDNSAKDKASALVAEKGKPAERLYVGDRLPGGAELYSVEVDHIVLRRNGKMEKLTYPDEDGRPTVPLSNFTNVVSQAAEISASSNANRGEQQQSIRQRLEELRNLARERRAARQ